MHLTDCVLDMGAYTYDNLSLVPCNVNHMQAAWLLDSLQFWGSAGSMHEYRIPLEVP